MASKDDGIQIADSAVNIAVRNVTAVAMDEATTASTAASSAIQPSGENAEMGGDWLLDYSLDPTKDEPPATRQREDGDFGAMALTLRAPKPATARKRPSPESPPRPKDRSRTAQSTWPWPGSAPAVHDRAAPGNDEWAITAIVRQLEIVRGQIAMLKESAGSLHASRLQDAADMLDLSNKVDARDFEQPKQIINVANEVNRVYTELNEDVGRMGLLVARPEASEADVAKMRGYITASEAREAKMVSYLEKPDPERPNEGQTIMASFNVIDSDREETKGHFAGRVAFM